jgi:arylsulfatase A
MWGKFRRAAAMGSTWLIAAACVSGCGGEFAEAAEELARSSTAEATVSKPNIILIVADDYGIVDVGAYGGDAHTPVLDSMAAGGVRFQYAYSMPLCAPTRATLITGQYPFRTGVTGNSTGTALKPTSSTIIAKLLQSAGYATAVAGKWAQLRFLDSKSDAAAWGWDEFMRWVSPRSRYWGPTFNKDGIITTHPASTYGPDLVHNFVVDFIRRKKGTPFFVYYPMLLIHQPLTMTPDSAEGSTTIYQDMVQYHDKLVGKLLAELDREGIRRDTLVILMGDNGSTRKSAGVINGRRVEGQKGRLQEGGSRVPLIANWPGTTPAGVVSNALVDASDIYPTIAEIVGVPLPGGVTIDGKSFAHLLSPALPTRRSRSWVYVQLDDQHYVRNRPPGYKLYQDCTFVDMRDAPFGEIVIQPSQKQAVFDMLNGRMRSLRGVPCQ